jgi:peptidoglycan/xylan/chitin deacetylase (PgdA/CDA1 family)
VIDDLMATYYLNEKELLQSVYMSRTLLSELHDEGMTLGSHSVNHPVMSRLTIEEQEKEIRESFNVLETITGNVPIRTFCYPYGGYHTFSRETESLLEKASCQFSFNVESRDITRIDLAERRHALPRFDCNEFPYGTSQGIG